MSGLLNHHSKTALYFIGDIYIDICTCISINLLSNLHLRRLNKITCEKDEHDLTAGSNNKSCCERSVTRTKQHNDKL